MPSSTPCPQESPYADRRLYPRVPVALPAFLQVNGERLSGQILDLSSGGAKVNCPEGVPVGTSLVLDCGMLRREAIVRWQNGPLLGLCFESGLDEREISELIDRSRALDSRMKSRD